MKLTDKACKNAQPADKPRKLADSHGLYLEIMPGGAKYWRFKYRFQGKEKRLALGVYPFISLAEARQKRDKAKRLLLEGQDPSSAKKEEKRTALQNAINTFEDIAREWHQNNLEKWNSRYGKTILHRLETDVFPTIGAMPIAQIRAPELLAIVRNIEKRGAYEIAHRAIQTCGQIFRYAVITGRADRNPATDFRGALKATQKTHYAAIESDDLPEFTQALERNDARLYLHTRLAIKLLMMTFVRTSEMIEAKWSEFNFQDKKWVIPAERMKMRRPHIVPLSRQAIGILEQLKELSRGSDYVFPSQINLRKHMSNNTILKALERMGYKGRMTGHGFRALAMSTIKEKLGYRHEVIDRQLAHAPANKIDAAYDRAKFLDERKIMMQEWSDYLEKMAKSQKIYILHETAE